MRKIMGLFLIGAVFSPLLSSCDQMVKKRAMPGPNDRVYPVAAAPVLQKDIPNVVQYTGRFVPLNRLVLKSDFTGRVQALSVTEGQSVLSGDVLLKIEDERLPWVMEQQRAALREAEAQMDYDSRSEGTFAQEDAFEEPVEEFEEEVAEEAPIEEEPPEALEETEEGFAEAEEGETAFQRLARLRRRAALARRRTAPRQVAPPREAPENPELVESRQALNQAKIERIRAELGLTEKQMEGSTITSPLDGFVNKIQINEGSMVKPEDALMEIITVDPIDLSMMVPKNEIQKIDKQMKIQVAVPDLNGRTFDGEISFIGAELDPMQKSVEVRLRVTNRDLQIKSGMEGIAQLSVEKASHLALMVPLEAVFQEADQSYLYVIKGNLAIRRKVETGSTFDNLVEIRQGLRRSDQVVTQGVDQLQGEEEFIKI